MVSFVQWPSGCLGEWLQEGLGDQGAAWQWAACGQWRLWALCCWLAAPLGKGGGVTLRRGGSCQPWSLPSQGLPSHSQQPQRSVAPAGYRDGQTRDGPAWEWAASQPCRRMGQAPRESDVPGGSREALSHQKSAGPLPPRSWVSPTLGARGPAPKQVHACAHFRGCGQHRPAGSGLAPGLSGKGCPRVRLPPACGAGRPHPPSQSPLRPSCVCERPAHAKSGGSRDLTRLASIPTSFFRNFLFLLPALGTRSEESHAVVPVAVTTW